MHKNVYSTFAVPICGCGENVAHVLLNCIISNLTKSLTLLYD